LTRKNIFVKVWASTTGKKKTIGELKKPIELEKETVEK